MGSAIAGVTPRDACGSFRALPLPFLGSTFTTSVENGAGPGSFGETAVHVMNRLLGLELNELSKRYTFLATTHNWPANPGSRYASTLASEERPCCWNSRISHPLDSRKRRTSVAFV